MAQTIPPLQQAEFHGVYTAGNPIARPRGTAAKCENFRIMPGFWLRTRGGRKYRNTIPSSGEAQQIHAFRYVDWPGSADQLVQAKYAATNESKWHWMSLTNYTIYEVGDLLDNIVTLDIATANDSAFCLTNPAAACNLNDRPIFYNGYGTRDTASKPPVTSYYGYQFRYFGIDAYCPDANPAASFASGSGGGDYNTVANSVSIYVGLYSSQSEHYSNGVLAGTIEATGGTGTITVANLDKLTTAYHSLTERGELYYVFYATIDGGTVPYLILNSTLDGPFKVAATSTSATLNVTSAGDNGWVLDETKEMPTDNHPPRPMRSMAYVRGRIYGALLDGGSGNAVRQARPGVSGLVADFSYVPTARELAAVVWSKAAGDSTATDLLGDPLQCWPFGNIAFTPSCEQPLRVAPAIDGTRVLVITATSTFLLEEVADGVHEWITVSRTHGIKNPVTLRDTPYGSVWVDQRNEIVCLPPGATQVVVLSKGYRNLLTGTVRCADYLLDPPNDIDRYEVFLADGTSVCHDFAIGGEAYSSTNRDYTAAATVVDATGKRHHIVAKSAIYTQEAQPEDGLILTTDENSDATLTQVTGEYIRNWDDFGDSNNRKGLFQVDVIGDGATSTALGASPLSIEWYADFENVTFSNKKTCQLAKQPQSTTDSAYTGKPTNGFRFWYKLALRLAGHSTDDASFATHADPSTQGDAGPTNFYGGIVRLLFHVNAEMNRP